jgi:cell division septation protein DedD
MKDFFLSLHPGVRIVLVLVLVIGLLVVLNYRPAEKKPVEDFDEFAETTDEAEDTGGQIIYETIEPAPTQETPAPPVETAPEPESVQQPAPSKPAPVQPAAPQPSPPQLTSNFYSIQIASSQDLARAQDLAGRLKKEGLAAEVVSQSIEGSTWHRVYVGRYAAKEEASAKLPALRQKYPDSFIKFRSG